MSQLASKDYLVFIIYFVIVAAYGYWIYRRRRSREHDSKAFFLAEGSLTWWAIGASLIASNISAEQFIGTSGSAFKMGLAIASYEWMAAATLIIVAIFYKFLKQDTPRAYSIHEKDLKIRSRHS